MIEKKNTNPNEDFDEKNKVSVVNEGFGEDKVFDKIRKNPWIISTFVFGIVLVGILIFNSGGLTGSVVSEDVIADNLISFIEARTGNSAEIVSVEKGDSFYEVVVDMDGQKLPLSVSFDGKYIIQPIPITLEDSEEEDNGTGDVSVTKSDKPKVELFVMSHCPYGTQIEKGMIPVVELLGDKIDFELKFVNYAMHGEKEVLEELNQYCIQKEQNDKFLSYLKCFLDKGEGESCLTKIGINKGKLVECTAGADKEFEIKKNLNDKSLWSGGQFPQFLTYAQENEDYGVRGSPTLVINGAQASSGRDSASLLKVICSAFNEAPEECSEELSSASPSAGFGYSSSGSASDGTTASGGCSI